MFDPLIRVRTRRAFAVTCCAFVVAVGTALLAYKRPTPNERLLSVYGQLDQRPVVARLSSLPHLRINTNGAPATSLSLRAAAIAVLNSDGTVEERAAAAILAGHAPTATNLLTKAVRDHPDDPTLWSDLAAVRYEVGRATQSYDAYVGALAATDYALDLQPRHAGALFNRGLVLDALGFRNDASSVFQEVLSIDRESGWADEIRRKGLTDERPSDADEWKASLAILVQAADRGDSATVRRIVGRFPQFSRAWGEGEFPARWGDATISGNEAVAMHWLRVIQIIGAALQQTSGEAIVTDTAAAIERARSTNARPLAAAHVAYRHARKTFDGRNVMKGLPLLRDAERRFVTAGSPAAYGAALFLANALFDAHEPEEAAAIYARLDAAVPRQYGALRAQLHWLHSLLTGWAGRPFESIEAARAGVEDFDRLGEHENAARMRSTVASLLAVLGDDSEGRRVRLRAVRGIIQSGNVKSIEVTLNHAARDEIDDQSWEFARALLRLQLARPSTNPRLAFDGRMALALVDGRLTSQPPDFREAVASAAAIPDPALLADAQNELAYARAVHHNDDSSQQLHLLNEVIEYRKSHARLSLLPDPYVHRAHAYLAVGNARAAEADLTSAISLIESSAADITDKTLRDVYLGTSLDPHRDLAALLFEQDRAAEAFAVADRGRARRVAERMLLPQTAFHIENLQQRLPEDVVVAHYTALPDRLVIVTIDRRNWSSGIVSVSRDEIEALRNRMIHSIETESATEIRTVFSVLFRHLIAPIAENLEGKQRLVVIPDDSTNAIPFQALQSLDGRLLIENWTILYAPSAATAFRDNASSNRNLTVVSDPAFDPKVFPNLERLGAARRDADRLRTFFSTAHVLTGSSATPENVMNALAHSGTIHIAAHALSDSTDASRSLIVLAPARGSGALYARDIVTLRLSDAPTVVIATCRSGTLGGGKSSTRSLALSFLAAGSATVISTLWDVDDAVSSTITTEFYRGIAAGHEPAAALRAAQLSAVRNGIAAHDWTAFQIHSTRR